MYAYALSGGKPPLALTLIRNSDKHSPTHRSARCFKRGFECHTYSCNLAWQCHHKSALLAALSCGLAFSSKQNHYKRQGTAHLNKTLRHCEYVRVELVTMIRLGSGLRSSWRKFKLTSKRSGQSQQQTAAPKATNTRSTLPTLTIKGLLLHTLSEIAGNAASSTRSPLSHRWYKSKNKQAHHP